MTPTQEKIVAEPVAVSVEIATQLLGVGRSTIYELIRTGELRSFKIGARRLVPMDGIHELREKLETARDG